MTFLSRWRGRQTGFTSLNGQVYENKRTNIYSKKLPKMSLHFFIYDWILDPVQYREKIAFWNYYPLIWNYYPLIWNYYPLIWNYYYYPLNYFSGMIFCFRIHKPTLLRQYLEKPEGNNLLRNYLIHGCFFIYFWKISSTIVNVTLYIYVKMIVKILKKILEVVSLFLDPLYIKVVVFVFK